MNSKDIWVTFDWILTANHVFLVQLDLKHCHDFDDLKTHLMHRIHKHDLHKYGLLTDGILVAENAELNTILKINSKKNPLIFFKIFKSNFTD